MSPAGKRGERLTVERAIELTEKEVARLRAAALRGRFWQDDTEGKPDDLDELADALEVVLGFARLAGGPK